MLDIGDLVLVERCEQIDRHGIYCFFHEGQFVVRFIVWGEGELMMIPSYAPYPIRKLEMSDDFRLFGKVRAAMTRIYYDDPRWSALEVREQFKDPR